LGTTSMMHVTKIYAFFPKRLDRICN